MTLEIHFDFITKSGFSHLTIDNTHYMVNNESSLKFVGWREGGATEWGLLGPRTASWLKRSLLVLEIEAGLHD